MDAETPHDPFARECVIVGLPASELHDRPCPACREMSALVDLDPEFGTKEDGRPRITVEPEAEVGRDE